MDRKIVSREEWTRARLALLAKEKDFDRKRDALSAERRELPWVKLDKKYVFQGPQGARSLADLFDDKHQLIVYHFMLDPAWQEGCKSCSYVVDNIEGGYSHFQARDTAFAAISRAKLETISAFEKRMGWTFRWLSSFDNDFNYDFHVSFRAGEPAVYNYVADPSATGERPGLSVFYREGDDVFHTYSTYARGLDHLIGTYNYLDLTPLGRNEAGHGMKWLRHHDKYGG